ncbi:MAG: rRNA maturation RNase YbeY [Polyangiaceae bacterium]|nr:rRNA maturation RNase YbeY [Polyangiaceae bacterium]
MKRLVRASEIVSRAEIMLTHLKEGQSEVSILLCDDPTIHSLNRDYRKKDKPTDVLAFAMREGKFAQHAGNMLGDVIISLETAARQANERKIGLLDEVTMLLAHGLLHLLGWDHQTDKEERAMTKKTNQLVALF